MPLASLSFYVGLELGQIDFVLVLMACGLAQRAAQPRLVPRSQAVPVYLIGSLAAFWMLERLARL